MVAPRYRHAIRISDVVSSSTSLEVPVVTRNSHSRSKRRIPVAATLARFLPALLIIVLWWSSSVFFHSPSPLLPSGEPLATRLDIHGGEAPLPSSLGYDTVQRVGPVADFTENEEIGRPTIERQTTKVLTIFMESPLTLDTTRKPLPIRKTFASKLRKVEFPNLVTNCAASIQQELPVDYFPESDPFLPWIHDYFVNQDASEVRFVAQNRRRCETGEGKEIVMRYWEPQVALMQAVPVKEESAADGTVSYRLASPDEATVPETRFLCHFHDDAGRSESSLSTFSFNYEYVLWRKRKLPMYQLTGPDVSKIELSQLLFQCPVPTFFRDAILTSSSVEAIVHLDVVPIRTPPRLNEQLFTADMIGEHEFAAHGFLFNASEHFGTKHVLPSIQDSGRWANLPICPPPAKITPEKRKKPYRLVACTWTAASYRRRGDVTVISDSVARLKEWIVFHKLVGVDHIYLYDNTQLNDELRTSPLQAIVQEFSDYVTYIPWPAIICSNNRPNFRNPGERSSQYAADAACRSKYGDLTEWMAFIDSDEYLVPMSKNQSWPDILQDMETQNVDVLKMRSSRGRPRHDYMEVTDDPAICVRRNRRMSRLQEEPCAVPRRNETFLRVFK